MFEREEEGEEESTEEDWEKRTGKYTETIYDFLHFSMFDCSAKIDRSVQFTLAQKCSF